VAVAFGIGAIVIALLQKNPLSAYYALFSSALGTSYGLGQTINLGGVLLIAGLSAVVAYKSGIYTCGIDGQLILGALASMAIVLQFQHFGFVASVLAIIGAMAAGALFALIPALLKAKLSTNEIVTTLLMNYIALLIVNYAVTGPMRNPGASYPTTYLVPLASRLPTVPLSTINICILIAVILSVATLFLVVKTKLGFEMRIMGSNLKAARYAGINIPRRTILIFLISGMLAGLAGSMLALGISYSAYSGIDENFGFLGIGIAMVAQLNPLAVVPTALFVSVLHVGADGMQAATGVPSTIAEVIVGLMIMVILIRPVFDKFVNKRSAA
jgi:simple sugar transport system permease protein